MKNRYISFSIIIFFLFINYINKKYFSDNNNNLCYLVIINYDVKIINIKVEYFPKY